jgi:hypothetical protein
MKLATIALAGALAFTSTFAVAQGAGGAGTGAQGGATGVPGVKTNPTPDQATSTSGANANGAMNQGTTGNSTGTTGPVESNKMGGPNEGRMTVPGGANGTSGINSTDGSSPK